MESVPFSVRALVLAVCGMSVTPTGHASVVVDMEGFAQSGFVNTQYYATDQYDDKLLFMWQGAYVDSEYVQVLSGAWASNGTDYLVDTNTKGITVSAQSGDLFSASSFEASEYFHGFQREQSIVVTGTYADNSTTVQYFTTDDVFGFEKFTLNPTFDDLKSLNLKSASAIMAWDNIVLDVTAVPEATSILAWTMVLGGIGLIAYQRQLFGGTPAV